MRDMPQRRGGKSQSLGYGEDFLGGCFRPGAVVQYFEEIAACLAGEHTAIEFSTPKTISALVQLAYASRSSPIRQIHYASSSR